MYEFGEARGSQKVNRQEDRGKLELLEWLAVVIPIVGERLAKIFSEVRLGATIVVFLVTGSILAIAAPVVWAFANVRRGEIPSLDRGETKVIHTGPFALPFAAVILVFGVALPGAMIVFLRTDAIWIGIFCAVAVVALYTKGLMGDFLDYARHRLAKRSLLMLSSDRIFVIQDKRNIEFTDYDSYLIFRDTLTFKRHRPTSTTTTVFLFGVSHRDRMLLSRVLRESALKGNLG